MRRTSILNIAAAACCLAVLPMPLAAQGWIEPVPGPRPLPQLGVVKLRTAVDVRIDGRVAHIQVEEWFRNDGPAFGEADYMHPLPGEAVFQSYSLYQGDAELRGETLEAAEARRIYEQIVRARRDPALIEYLGRGMIRARVFPFERGEVRRITLRYTQLLDRQGDALQFRYAAARPSPRALAVRGGVVVPGLPQPEPALGGPAEANAASNGAADSATVRLRVVVEDGAAYRDAYSPTHDVRVRREGRRMIVEPRGVVAGELALLLPFATRTVGLTLVAHRPGASEDGYFMLSLSPEHVAAARVPRDVTAVIDVSGSMSGEKMEQTRRALVQLLGTLDARDRFRLITFSSGIASYRAGWTEATRAEVADARRWIEMLHASGGTNIAGALDEAFAVAPGEGRLPIVLFMTDGLPTVGERHPGRLSAQAERLRGETRIFAFGVGYDVNTQLLDALSAAARGSTQYVRPDEDVEVAIGALAAKISHPVLADLVIDGAPVRLREVYPVRLPDLFAGEDLVIFGRYAIGARNVTGDVAISGQRAAQTNARRERYATRATFPAHTLANDWVPRLWASRKLGELARQIRLNGEDPELIEEMRATALRYGLLSEYTSYLVLEPGVQPSIPIDAVTPRFSMTGERAVVAADASRRAREATNLRDVDAAQVAVALAAPPAGGTRVRGERGAADGARIVAGRYFRQVDGVWRDGGIAADARVIAIEPFSAAYFQLLGGLPELRAVFAAFEHVEVGGGGIALRIAPGGESTIAAARVAELRRAFRARAAAGG